MTVAYPVYKRDCYHSLPRLAAADGDNNNFLEEKQDWGKQALELLQAVEVGGGGRLVVITICTHSDISTDNWSIPSPDGIPLRGCRLFFFFFFPFFLPPFWRFSGPHRGKQTPDLDGILQKHAH